jgi:DNA-binding MarR family transcriptional regulator
MIREDLKLENQLCFRVHRLSRMFISLYQPLMTRLGITYPQYLVLLALWESDALDYQQLAERLGYSTGTLTPVIQRLEQMKLVRRKKHPADRRKTCVELTQGGLSIKAEVETMADRFSDGGLLAGRESIEEYKKCMDTLSADLSKVAKENSNRKSTEENRRNK